MKKIILIAQKELLTQFRSPIAYILLFLTLSIFHVFFFIIIDENQEATLRDIFLLMEFLFVFIIPLMTMKLFAEERFSGTIEFLRTAPVSSKSIILGKYFGAVAFFSFILLATMIYAVILDVFSQPDRAMMGLGYLGVWLEGAFFISIGLMTSSWTRNQILAAMTSYVFIMGLYFILTIQKYMPEPVQPTIYYLSTMKHLENFTAGILSTSDLMYYLSGVVFCLVITRIGFEKRL